MNFQKSMDVYRRRIGYIYYLAFAYPFIMKPLVSFVQGTKPFDLLVDLQKDNDF